MLLIVSRLWSGRRTILQRVYILLLQTLSKDGVVDDTNIKAFARWHHAVAHQPDCSDMPLGGSMALSTPPVAQERCRFNSFDFASNHLLSTDGARHVPRTLTARALHVTAPLLACVGVRLRVATALAMVPLVPAFAGVCCCKYRTYRVCNVRRARKDHGSPDCASGSFKLPRVG